MKAPKKRKKLRQGIAHVLPAQCLYCDSDKGFETLMLTRKLPFRDCVLEVSFEVTQCKACGETFLSEAQAEAQLKHTVVAFQQEAGLLTAKELIARRHALGLRSQQKLVDASSGAIAIATLKRIEAGQWVQDKTTDIAIRATLETLEQRQTEAAFQQICSQTMQGEPFVTIFQAPASELNWSKPFGARARSKTICLSDDMLAGHGLKQQYGKAGFHDSNHQALVSC
jgi:hypothetical protein